MLALAFGTWACGTLSVSTEPEGAEVLVWQAGQQEPKVLGKTPLKVAAGELEEFTNTDSLLLQLKLDGYQSEQYILPLFTGTDLEIKAKLQRGDHIAYEKLNQITTLVLHAERLVSEKQFDEALKAVADLKKFNDNLTAAFELEGSVHFLQGNYEKSRFAWQRSLEIDGENPDAKKMLEIIDAKLGRGGSTQEKTP
jgi:tetratricopeptide (TPR) repeat protein